uniref:Uncharacterized protein n=1 Tax=Cacopsylla melanoneura TaxID=428564 RepID=A0A8D8U537_9HEMI
MEYGQFLLIFNNFLNSFFFLSEPFSFFFIKTERLSFCNLEFVTSSIAYAYTLVTNLLVNNSHSLLICFNDLDIIILKVDIPPGYFKHLLVFSCNRFGRFISKVVFGHSLSTNLGPSKWRTFSNIKYLFKSLHPLPP